MGRWKERSQSPKGSGSNEKRRRRISFWMQARRCGLRRLQQTLRGNKGWRPDWWQNRQSLWQKRIREDLTGHDRWVLYDTVHLEVVYGDVKVEEVVQKGRLDEEGAKRGGSIRSLIRRSQSKIHTRAIGSGEVQ
ncbi:hypothetical protein TWF730_002599 [Orbilia blumenaviensis]|uniref:Uncharacterized protein n=1 Tax=Orbilia blumenaviensis TaxID=1796055 RepID=A0AAV9UB35_9PEZI